MQSQMNPVHVLYSFRFQIYFNVTLQSVQDLLQSLFCSDFPIQNFLRTSDATEIYWHARSIMMNTAHIAERLTGPSCNFALKEFNGNILHWMPDLFKLIFKAINNFLVYCDKFYDNVTSRPTDFIQLFYMGLPVNRIYNFINHISILVLLILMIIIIVHIKDSALDIFQL
jgi:hypothetical protein